MKFTILNRDNETSARLGELQTAHGEILTPVFMPIGTHGAVKSLSPTELKAIGTQIILGNTYHLYLRPGDELVKQAGGLHQFMGWERTLLTDSGGFQVFSLAHLNSVTDEGVEFRSHLDGSKHFFTPAKSMEIQQHLGADIIMAFDECPPGQADYASVELATERSAKWLRECRDYLDRAAPIFEWEQTLLPIVQGGVYPELRKRSVETVLPYVENGVSIGGLAVGEEKGAMFEILDLMDGLLPTDKARYLMGVGRPTDIVRAVRLGMDMFDCVLPTRNARNGQLFTSQGVLNIRNARYRDDFRPVDEACECVLCQEYTRAYLRHLIMVNEIYGIRLATLHNLTYYQALMSTIRTQIKTGTFAGWAESFVTRHADDARM
jgi:queuine tRNA-ribosyltransferase